MSIGTPVEGSPGGSASTTLTIVVPSTSCIFVHTDGQNPPASSVSSNINGAFTLLQSAPNWAATGLYPTLWKLDNASAGTHTITITAGGATIYYTLGFYVTASTYDGSNTFLNSSLGIGTNILASGAITTNGADTVFSLILGSGSALATAGTSPNAFTTITLATGNSSGNFLQYFQQTAAGTINPTAGASTNTNFQGFTFSVTPISGIPVAWLV
jgi:hypothetical protein